VDAGCRFGQEEGFDAIEQVAKTYVREVVAIEQEAAKTHVPARSTVRPGLPFHLIGAQLGAKHRSQKHMERRL
jgi:hypothetical protein